MNFLPPSGKPVGQWRHVKVTGTGDCAGFDQPSKRACRSETAAAIGGETRLNYACNVRSPSREVLAVIGAWWRQNIFTTAGTQEMKKKRKRPTSDAQMEVAMCCGELLSGIEALTKPNYHKLNVRAGRNDRLLHAVLCAYAKHHLGIEDMGWNQLGDILHSAICNEIGDEAFCHWGDTIRPDDAN